MRVLRILFALATASVSSFGYAAPAGLAPGLADFERVQLAAPPTSADADSKFATAAPVVLELQGYGRSFRLELADNPDLLTNVAADARNAIHSRGDRFLSGRIAGNPESWVRLSWIDGRYSGGFFDGQTLWLIDQAAGLTLPAGRRAAPDATLLFRFEDLQSDELIDTGGVAANPGRPVSDRYAAFTDHLREVTELQGSALLSMPVTIVADTDFKDDLGPGAQSTAIGRINFIDGIYSDQLGTGIALWHYEQLTDNGPLTSTDPGDLLSPQFREFMRSGPGSDIPFRGLAHLFTGRNLDGSVVGIAYVGVLCSSFAGYGVDQNLSNNTTSALVFAHEVGHNFGAPHDGEGACSDETFEGIMNPSINGSQQFSDCSLAQMSDDVASASCLIDNPSFIFFDSFE